MERKERVAQSGQQNIINLKMDATFFFERAVQSLDRFHYDKALKYFRRAAEYEPYNPVNYCNLAGIYSELGNYEESNRILRMILESIDPDMTECFYYMANNYANMEQFERAEEQLIQYLELDSNGQFLEEAEEMLEMLSLELKRPAELRNIKCREHLFEHDQARMLLEEGRFAEATRKLEKLVKQNPTFLAARNNLSLAYYYMGDFKQCIATIREVLEHDEGNLHALCNLAVVLQQSKRHDELTGVKELLGKLYPFHMDHTYKLATTLGILGDQEGAYRHFVRLIRSGMHHDEPSVLHFAAVAAFNLGKLEDARRHWKSLKKHHPGSVIAEFYLKEWASLTQRPPGQKLPYQYQLPFEEKFKYFEQVDGAIPEEVKKDPLVRSSFIWALRHGDQATKLHVMQALSMIADEEVKATLHRFLLEPDEDDYLKRVAVFVLRAAGVKEPVKALMGGKKTVIAAQDGPGPGLPVWKPAWQSVLEDALQAMDGRYDLIQRHDMQTLWVEYLSKAYPDVPRISKSKGWAAALEYLTAKMHSKRVTMKELSELYGVSGSTIGKNAKLIDETCGLQSKMQAIWKTYLS
ncbi:DDE transposase family protein [Xylanibacillus composti]|uniref:Tetratricopeptide repeat protein n=1 Tax=Xylanibacillus composti TaxID=1572762 RepID=A0A8J4M0H0_9BACL|nr:tetratricopeptide repeat protein [Xylanibacillus composti]MDT9725061.1 DDE transposase family protein [Xylanibacillus composti]GIQ67459.1 hypothetical protein XYCOK13_02830 [Xylanibacillus composti]